MVIQLVLFDLGGRKGRKGVERKGIRKGHVETYFDYLLSKVFCTWYNWLCIPFCLSVNM